MGTGQRTAPLRSVKAAEFLGSRETRLELPEGRRYKPGPFGEAMKPDIHPIYPPARITCACGNVIETRSTRGSFNVEICSNCHPYFTGKYKLIDTAGRVERFRKKYEGGPGKAKAPK